jgi:hypothetical protein
MVLGIQVWLTLNPSPADVTGLSVRVPDENSHCTSDYHDGKTEDVEKNQSSSFADLKTYHSIQTHLSNPRKLSNVKLFELKFQAYTLHCQHAPIYQFL